MQIAALPLSALPRSYAGASLLAELLLGKYVNNLPFQCSIAMFKHAGVYIPASHLEGSLNQYPINN
jgi:transposase